MGFDVRYAGQDIFQVYAPIGKVSYGNPRAEWMLAARWAGIGWHEFEELDGLVQAEIVAMYRVYQRVESIIAWKHRPKRK